MHPQIVAMAAAEHVKDMQAVAIRGRRAREARRARRGAINVRAAHHGQRAVQEPCPQPPCPPVYVKAA
ncbi:MAG: hypothetical protein ACTHJW_11540 [Streptosporangiaceae bacterium]